MNKDVKKGLFTRFAASIAHSTGSPVAFAIASGTLVVWGFTGPYFHYSDTWQLVINTGTSLVTFLMVFLIQNTQNRDSKAAQLKLDELIRAMDGAHTVLLDLEELSDAEIESIRCKYEKIAELARERLRSGGTDTDIPDIIMDSGIDFKKVGGK